MQANWLRLRYWLGWGHTTLELRTAHRISLLNASVVSILFLFLPLIHIFAQMGGLSHFAIASYLNLVLDARFIALWGVSTLIFVLPMIWFTILAHYSMTHEGYILQGQYYDMILHNEYVISARIGTSEKTARWYALPISWEAAVRLPGATLELDVVGGTDYVRQLRRLGMYPQTLVQTEVLDEQETEIALAQIGASSEPTKKDQYELRTVARKKGMYWGVSPRSIGALASCMNFGGIVILSGTLFLLIFAFVFFPQSIQLESDRILLIIFCAISASVGLASSIWGAVMTSHWLRLRRLRKETPQVIDGQIESWATYQTIYNRNETIVKILLDPGKDRIFRVEPRFQQQVRCREFRVRITYLPTTELIISILPLPHE